MTFKECLENGLIKKDSQAKNKVRQEYLLGKRFLRSAKNNLEIADFLMTEIAAYNAIFHFSRALLFSKGYAERSHGCLFEALKVLYPEHRDLFSVASKIRLQRHNVQYNLGKVEKETAKFTYSFAMGMSKKIKLILSL